jgi:(p)ppGpp synthase/HD superfamily hydrolase
MLDVKVPLDIVQRAREFATKAHGQQLYGDHPYIYHPEQVRDVLLRYGHVDPEMLAAALLHDVIEDTPVNYNDVKAYFGRWVAELVYAVTDELGRNRRERHSKTYPKTADLREAVVLKLADRIANVEFSIAVNDAKRLFVYKTEQEDFDFGINLKSYAPKDMRDHLNDLLGPLLP